jgi:hypothetical protein
MAKSSHPKLFSIWMRTNIRIITDTHDSVRNIATTMIVGVMDGVLSIGMPGTPPDAPPEKDMIEEL